MQIFFVNLYTMFSNSFLCEANDAIHSREIMDAVRYQQAGGAAFREQSVRAEHAFEQVFTDVNVHCGQWIIQKEEIRIAVDGARDSYSLLLSARQIDASFADFCRIASR